MITSVPALVYPQPLGSATKVAGALAGSSTQRVSPTPEAFGSVPSVAVTVTCTGVLYQLFWPFGVTGASVTVETGGTLSRGTMVRFTVATFESLCPSLAQKVKLSVPKNPVSGV